MANKGQIRCGATTQTRGAGRRKPETVLEPLALVGGRSDVFRAKLAVPRLRQISGPGYLSVETAKPDQDVGCSARWKASISVGAGPFLASDPGSLSLPSSTVAHSIGLNAETCLSSIWRCRLSDTFPSRPPNPIGMLVVLPAGKLWYRLARVRFWLLVLVRFHCHRAPFGIQFI